MAKFISVNHVIYSDNYVTSQAGLFFTFATEKK